MFYIFFIGSVIYDWAKVAHANYEMYEVVKLQIQDLDKGRTGKLKKGRR